MSTEIIRTTCVYAAVAGSLSAGSSILIGATASAADAAVYIPWLTFLSLVVASPISLFLLQRSRPRPQTAPQIETAPVDYRLSA